MEKERKITAPEGREIEKVELVDGVAVITFREKERKLPKSWEEFCEMFPLKNIEYFIHVDSTMVNFVSSSNRRNQRGDRNMLPDRATAEAVLALCQLIQLRNCYNGDWVPDCNDYMQKKYVILFNENELISVDTNSCENRLLMFKTEELRDEFLKYFSQLIEKLKPLYGIKEGGEE